MTGKTHRVGGALCALAGYTYLESKGMLIADVKPLLQLTVIYPFALYGSVISDLDHHWESAPCKDAVSFIINRILHLTTKMKSKNPVLNLFNAKHRSWQTHSDLFFALVVGLYVLLIRGAVGSESVILHLVFAGLLLGVTSHLLLDSITPEGIHSVVLIVIKKITKLKQLPTKIRFVPKSSFFATDGPWEGYVRKAMWVICFIFIMRIIYVYLPYHITFS